MDVPLSKNKRTIYIRRHDAHVNEVAVTDGKGNVYSCNNSIVSAVSARLIKANLLTDYSFIGYVVNK